MRRREKVSKPRIININKEKDLNRREVNETLINKHWLIKKKWRKWIDE